LIEDFLNVDLMMNAAVKQVFSVLAVAGQLLLIYNVEHLHIQIGMAAMMLYQVWKRIS